MEWKLKVGFCSLQNFQALGKIAEEVVDFPDHPECINYLQVSGKKPSPLWQNLVIQSKHYSSVNIWPMCSHWESKYCMFKNKMMFTSRHQVIAINIATHIDCVNSHLVYNHKDSGLDKWATALMWHENTYVHTTLQWWLGELFSYSVKLILKA